jgi:magnesium chelatase family protein
MATQECPCGYLSDPSGRCRCAEQVQRYRMRLSGPLLDRIDMHIEVPLLKVARTIADLDAADVIWNSRPPV